MATSAKEVGLKWIGFLFDLPLLARKIWVHAGSVVYEAIFTGSFQRSVSLEPAAYPNALLNTECRDA